MSEHRFARPPRDVPAWDVERMSVPESGQVAGIRLEALERRRIAREKLKVASVVPGTFFRVDGAWYVVIKPVASPYGSRWLVRDVASPDAPAQAMVWSEVQFVAGA